jgi:DNA invertase Pin-like site-specific DNA recombinase
MTTPTTSRVSDAMVKVAENAFWPVYLESIRVHQASKAAHSAGMRSALEAALASQGDVVAVSELDKLARKWDAKSCRDYGQKSSHAGDLRRLLADHGVTYVIGGDLSAILSRGGK